MNFKLIIIKFVNKDVFILSLILIIGVVIMTVHGEISQEMNINSDENLWVLRSFRFVESLRNLDFISALQTVHPGITVMGISGIFVYLTHNLFSDLVFYDSFKADIYSTAFNIPIIISIIIFYFLLYFVLRKLNFNRTITFFVLIFYSINTTYIYNSTPVDKLSVMSLILSLLFLIIYVNERYEINKYLLLSSFFAAFGVLTKFSVLILIPFSFFILIYYSSLCPTKYVGAIKKYILYIIYFIFSIIIIFPGFLFFPTESINKIINTGNSVLIAGFNEPEVTYSYAEKITTYSKFFLNSWTNPFVFGLIIIFFILFFLRLAKKEIVKDNIFNNLYYKNIYTLLLFCVIYFFYIPLFTNFIYYRYMMPVFLILDIMAAVALYHVILVYNKRFLKSKSIKGLTLATLVIFYLFQFIYQYSIYIHIKN